MVWQCSSTLIRIGFTKNVFSFYALINFSARCPSTGAKCMLPRTSIKSWKLLNLESFQLVLVHLIPYGPERDLERFCSFYAQNVADNQPNKPGIVREISFPEPARFLAKTVKPLHSDGLHPIRSLFYPSCVEIECGTNPHHERHLQFGNVLRHEPFLLGRAQTYPKDIRSAFLYQAAQGRLFLGSQRSKRWLVGSYNLQPRKTRGEF